MRRTATPRAPAPPLPSSPTAHSRRVHALPLQIHARTRSRRAPWCRCRASRRAPAPPACARRRARREITRSSRIFQFACASSVTKRPSSSKKPSSCAITSGAQSVSLMKPSFSSSFSGSGASPRAGAARQATRLEARSATRSDKERLRSTTRAGAQETNVRSRTELPRIDRTSLSEFGEPASALSATTSRLGPSLRSMGTSSRVPDAHEIVDVGGVGECADAGTECPRHGHSVPAPYSGPAALRRSQLVFRDAPCVQRARREIRDRILAREARGAAGRTPGLLVEGGRHRVRGSAAASRYQSLRYTDAATSRTSIGFSMCPQRSICTRIQAACERHGKDAVDAREAVEVGNRARVRAGRIDEATEQRGLDGGALGADPVGERRRAARSGSRTRRTSGPPRSARAAGRDASPRCARPRRAGRRAPSPARAATDRARSRRRIPCLAAPRRCSTARRRRSRRSCRPRAPPPCAAAAPRGSRRRDRARCRPSRASRAAGTRASRRETPSRDAAAALRARGAPPRLRRARERLRPHRRRGPESGPAGPARRRSRRRRDRARGPSRSARHTARSRAMPRAPSARAGARRRARRPRVCRAPSPRTARTKARPRARASRRSRTRAPRRSARHR